ncbi:MAG: hypothetical protein BWY95_00722 [Bacteroidetes bacterium ADurb.BinA104]|nr:MAG: hypothetical protein BWY95_00722 [Bacteroidetes bacterium ADurb.BinA104]
MIRLETSTGEILSRILKEISPIEYSSNRQVNRLLDGSYHVQIVGSALKSMEGTIVSTFNQAEKLNSLIDLGTPLVLIFLDKKYLVYADDKIVWKRINFAHGNKDKSLFEGKLRMILKEEVAL